jgi:hypothetical protein
MGKILVDYFDVNSDILKVDISSYAAGLYFVKINNSVIKKIIKN